MPSKTFLLGEYLALRPGPALVAATNPRFAIRIEEDNKHINTMLEGIHPNSPAGQLFKDYKSLLKGLKVNFDDPHQGQGGFGASGAQFLGIYMLIQKLQHKDFNQHHLTATYRHYHQSGSGADVISQYNGHITLFKGLEYYPETLIWPFENLGFMIMRTGFKIATHDHLSSNFDYLPYASLEAVVCQAVDGIKNNNETLFVAAINSYGDILMQHDMVYKAVQPLIRSWQGRAGVMAVKGCGAMSADVLAIVYDKKRFDYRYCSYIAGDGDLTTGLTVC